MKILIDSSLIDNKNQEEHYIKRGDPTKPTYYIIRPLYTSSGLFWHFCFSTGAIRYALSNCWIPVVDLQNYPNPYLEPEKLGKENSWEYFFEQPFGIGLEEAYNGENVILSNIKSDFLMHRHIRPDIAMKFTDEAFSFYRILVKLGLLKVKPEFVEEASAAYRKLFSPTDRVLGVKLRGTDYVASKPKYHAIPPP